MQWFWTVLSFLPYQLLPNTDSAPLLLSGHKSMWTEISYCAEFVYLHPRRTATSCGEQTVALYQDSTASPCSRALLESFPASQERLIIYLFLNQKFQHCIFNILPLIPVLSHIIFFSSSRTTCLKTSLILSSHLRPGLKNGLCPSGFATKTFYAFLYPPTLTTLPARLIFLCLADYCLLWSRVQQIARLPIIQGVTGGKGQTSGGCSLC